MINDTKTAFKAERMAFFEFFPEAGEEDYARTNPLALDIDPEEALQRARLLMNACEFALHKRVSTAGVQPAGELKELYVAKLRIQAFFGGFAGILGLIDFEAIADRCGQEGMASSKS